MSSEAPLCQFCRHRHHQGTKCSICGHVGKSNLYGKMRMKAAQLHSYSIEIFEHQPHRNDGEEEVLWEISTEIRKKIFCEEFQSPEEDEFDELDHSSRHLVGFVGDLPVLTLRWHLFTLPNGDNVARIDRCGVLPSYRSQKLASQTMELVVKDIHQVSQLHGVPIPSLQILAPQASLLEQCLQRHGYSLLDSQQQDPDSDLVMRGGMPHRYLGKRLS